MPSDRPKVLHVIGGLPVGGAESVLYRLLDRSSRGALEPWVLSMKDRGAFGDRLLRKGIGVLTLDMKRPSPSPVALWRFRRHLLTLQPQLLVGWMYHGNLVADIARGLLRRRVPMVWNLRHTPGRLRSETFTTRWEIRIGARRARRASKVVYNSMASMERHIQLGYPRQGAVVLPNGFDCEQFKPSPTARRDLRRELGIDEQAVLLGRIGRFHPQKDYPTLLEACETSLRCRTNVHLVLAGPGVDHENLRLAEWIARTGLGPRVHLLGTVTRMPQLLAGLDLVCSSSAFGESFPNVVAEAMACGVPCVVTDVGDSEALVGATGRVVVPGDADALARALSELLDLDPADRRALGREARDRIQTHFSAEAVFPRYEKIWREALGADPRDP